MPLADGRGNPARTGPGWPGDFLLHPVALSAVVLLLINDWYAKREWPGMITGKLSDVAGLVFFPLLLVAAAEFLARLLSRPWLATTRTVLWVALAIGLLFAGTKCVGAVRTTDEAILGSLRWAPHAIAALVAGDEPGPIVRPHVAADLTDLLAVPFVLASVWITSGYRTTDPCEHEEADR